MPVLFFALQVEMQCLFKKEIFDDAFYRKYVMIMKIIKIMKNEGEVVIVLFTICLPVADSVSFDLFYFRSLVPLTLIGQPPW